MEASSYVVCVVEALHHLFYRFASLYFISIIYSLYVIIRYIDIKIGYSSSCRSSSTPTAEVEPASRWATAHRLAGWASASILYIFVQENRVFSPPSIRSSSPRSTKVSKNGTQDLVGLRTFRTGDEKSWSRVSSLANLVEQLLWYLGGPYRWPVG